MVQKFPKLLVLEEAGTETDSPVLRAYGLVWAISVKTGEACALSSRGVSRKCYITTVTGNSWLQLDAMVDATFIDLLR